MIRAENTNDGREDLMLGLIKPSLMIGGFYIAWQLGILQVMLGIAGLVILAAGNVLLYVLQLIAG